MRGAWLYCSAELVDSGRPLLPEQAEAVAESRPWNTTEYMVRVIHKTRLDITQRLLCSYRLGAVPPGGSVDIPNTRNIGIYRKQHYNWLLL